MKVEKTINWRLFARNRRFLLFAAGMGLLSALLVMKAILPLISSISSINKTVSDEDKMVTMLAQKTQHLRELSTQDTFARQDLVNKILPSKKPVLELLTGLSVVAGKSGVTFSDFQVSPGAIATDAAALAAQAAKKAKNATNQGYDVLKVKLTVDGNFSQIQSFLREVEQLAPLTTVTDLNLSIKRKKKGIVQADDAASAELMLSTYYYTQSLNAAITAPLPVVNDAHERLLTQLETFTFPTYEQQQQIISDGVLDLFGIPKDYASDVVSE